MILGCNASFTGYRETVESGDRFSRLPAYQLFDLMTGYSGKIGSVRGELIAGIDNVLNKQYEVMRSYPMPGRTFHITFTVELGP